MIKWLDFVNVVMNGGAPLTDEKILYQPEWISLHTEGSDHSS
jgi:hypothetical protein